MNTYDHLADSGAGGGFETPAPDSRKRARSSSPRKSRKKHRAPRVEPLPQAEFVGGKPPGGSRTNLKDYTEPARKLLKCALHKYETRIGTINPYPAADLQMQWAKEIWDEVCKEADERMQLTERMASMIIKYGPHARSVVTTCVRPLVAPTYGFKLGDSDKIVQKNLNIYKELLDESGFHYADTKLRTGYAKNSIVMEGIRVTWFKNKAGRGVLFVESFSPITLVTLALIFTSGWPPSPSLRGVPNRLGEDTRGLYITFDANLGPRDMPFYSPAPPRQFTIYGRSFAAPRRLEWKNPRMRAVNLTAVPVNGTVPIPSFQVEFCIEEYSTGRFQQAIFDETQNKDRYSVHLQDLTEWAALKPSVTDVIRQRMHDKLRASTGAALVKPAGRMSDAGRARALQELEAMTVEEEGDVEDEQ
ncbi:hypothetical protein C8R46DRAFT_1210392 [Mycena filopes]|nr:hypothetical protein C8R46DRAFT_1210392 [Mycena filopes]